MSFTPIAPRAARVLALLIAFSGDLHAAPAANNIDVRVLTYNIHRDIGASDSNVSSQPALARVVNYLRPDIWTINELGGNNVRFNTATAHDYLVSFIQQNLTIFGSSPQENVNYFIYISAINDSYDTTAIVSRYPFVSTQTYSDAGNGFNRLRGLARASCSLTNGLALDVFTTHLKALNSTTDAEKRQTEADVDRSNIASWISTHQGDAIVVTGDWNETEDAGEKTNWSSHQIGDLLPMPNESYHPITTMRSSGLLDPSPASIAGKHDTIDATRPTSRFDYTMYAESIFRGGIVFDTKQYTAAQLLALNTMNDTTFVASDSASASDHLPVFSIFRIGFAPELLAVAREGTDLTITYKILMSPALTHVVEQSTDLVSWTTATPNDTVLQQASDSVVIKSSVSATGFDHLFLRVRVDVAP